MSTPSLHLRRALSHFRRSLSHSLPEELRQERVEERYIMQERETIREPKHSYSANAEWHAAAQTLHTWTISYIHALLQRKRWTTCYSASAEKLKTTTAFHHIQILIVNASSIPPRPDRMACAQRAVYHVRSITCITIRHVLAAARDEICKILDLRTLSAHLWNVVWPWSKHGLWEVLFFDGLRSIQRIIRKHVLVTARNEICKVLDLHTFSEIWTCFKSIGELNGFMHMLDAVLVDKSWCNSMKRTLATIKVWFINMLCLSYILISFWLVFYSRAVLIMLWHEDSFKPFIITEDIFMQNEYGLGKWWCDVDHLMHFCPLHRPV